MILTYLPYREPGTETALISESTNESVFINGSKIMAINSYPTSSLSYEEVKARLAGGNVSQPFMYYGLLNHISLQRNGQLYWSWNDQPKRISCLLWILLCQCQLAILPFLTTRSRFYWHQDYISSNIIVITVDATTQL